MTKPAINKRQLAKTTIRITVSEPTLTKQYPTFFCYAERKDVVDFGFCQAKSKHLQDDQANRLAKRLKTAPPKTTTRASAAALFPMQTPIHKVQPRPHQGLMIQ